MVVPEQVFRAVRKECQQAGVVRMEDGDAIGKDEVRIADQVAQLSRVGGQLVYFGQAAPGHGRAQVRRHRIAGRHRVLEEGVDRLPVQHVHVVGLQEGILLLVSRAGSSTTKQMP